MGVIRCALCSVFLSGAMGSLHLHQNNKTAANTTRPLPGDPDVHSDWDYKPFNDPDVVAKFTDAESVSEVLFTMACSSKHKNDIDGKARDKAKDEKFNEEEFSEYVKHLQDKNLATMKE